MAGHKHSCYDCKHLRRETESWEMPHIRWWECSANKSRANLLSFPFRNTKCRDFSPANITPAAQED